LTIAEINWGSTQQSRRYKGGTEKHMSQMPILTTGWWCNNHLEKYEFVNGKDDIPYMKWKIKKCVKPPIRPHIYMGMQYESGEHEFSQPGTQRNDEGIPLEGPKFVSTG